MDIENVNQAASLRAPEIVDTQVKQREAPEQKQNQNTPEADRVEISSEAISANAVQNTPNLPENSTPNTSDQGQREGSVSDTPSPKSEADSVNDQEGTAPEVGLKVEGSAQDTATATEAASAAAQSQENENLAAISEDLNNLRQKTAENFDSRRTTKFKVQDGNVSVTVQKGDSEIEIPPEEVINTKTNLKQRLQAFVDASKVDINA